MENRTQPQPERDAAGYPPDSLWESFYRMAEAKQQEEAPWGEALDAYLRAYQASPDRAEPLYQIGLHHRRREEYQLAHLFFTQAMSLPRPPEGEGRSVQKGVYDYALPLEYALCCAQLGEHERAVETYNSLLYSNKVPLELLNQIIERRDDSLEALYPKVANPSRRDNKIKVCVPFHNPGAQLANCLNSLLYQDYQNFELIFIDDGSSDGSHAIIPTDDPRVTLVRNEKREGWAACLDACLARHCAPEDIVFPLSGTRRLSYCDALLAVNEFFNSYDCTVMYGQHIYHTGQLGLTVPLTGEATLRTLKEAGHALLPFVFRCGLYQKLSAEDSPRGLRTGSPEEWPDEVAESALSYALLEKCGLRAARFSSHVLATINLVS